MMKSSGDGGYVPRPTRGDMRYKSVYTFYVLPTDKRREKYKIHVDKNAKNDDWRDDLDPDEAIGLLSELIADQMFAKTSGLGLYQAMLIEELKETVDKVLAKYDVKGKNSDNI